jgi:hypothetical protein
MSPHINAVLRRGPFDEQRARSFGLTPIRLMEGLTLFPLYPSGRV